MSENKLAPIKDPSGDSAFERENASRVTGQYLPELHNTSKIVGENLNLPSHSSFLNGYRV